MRLFEKLLPVSCALVLTIGSAHAYVGKWHSFTNKDRVSSLIAHEGFVYAGTQGGIRRINPVTLAEKTFDNLDGLLDCAIAGLAETNDGRLWAVSKSGYVSELSGNGWNASGQSYVAQHWNMNDRAVFASGSYLFLGSEKGLTVFDVVHRVAKANLTRFADKIDLSVLSLLVRGDTLYVGTPQGVYKAGVDFSNPFNPRPGFGNLSDPSIWTQAGSPANGSGGVQKYDYLTFVGGTLTTFGPGMLLQTPVHVETFTGRPAVIGSTAFATATDLNAALLLNGRLFTGGAAGISISSNPTGTNPALSSLTNPSQFPRDTVYNVAARRGDLWGQSMLEAYHIDPATGSVTSYASLYGVPTEEINTRHLRNLKLGDNGDAYIGSWGLGLLRVRNEQKRIWNGDTNPCIIEVIPEAHYTVVSAVSDISKNHLFFSVFKGEGGSTHQLVHLDTASGQIACLDSGAAGYFPHDIRFFSDTLIGIANDRGLTLYKVREGFSAPVVTSYGLWTTSGSANEAWAVAPDRWGRPWSLIGDQLAYGDSLDVLFSQNRTILKSTEGFSGTGCFTLQNDLGGSLWAGCSNGLYRIEPGLNGVEKIDHFGLSDGLLGLSVSDISIDPANGRIWIATDHGLSMLEGSAQPAVTTLQTVQVYPNPFRPQHRFVIFDNLPRDATVRIHTIAGAVVRTFHPNDLNGNQAQWDGTNENGKTVAPAVYLFSVTSGSTVERGKIIVAR